MSQASREREDGTLEPGRLLARRFRIVRFLGRRAHHGEAGEVYEALDVPLGVAVALRTLPRGLAADPAALERVKREVLLVRSLAHPAIGRTFDLRRDDALTPPLDFVVLELLSGESLIRRLARAGPMAPAEALPILVQAAEGLAAAHAAGVAHRDLRPANVFLEPGTTGAPPGRTGVRAVLVDFGLSLDASPGEAATSPYAAPELLRGEEVGPAADVHALGLLAYEMLSGRLPFDRDPPTVATDRRRREDPPPLTTVVPDLDPAWAEAIARALRSQPHRRFASPLDLARALSAAAPLAPLQVAHRALLLTDLVDSTRLVAELGDAAAGRVFAAHDRLARDLLRAHSGREIDRTDGFLLLFQTAADAARYAVDYHRALATDEATGAGIRLEARAAIHVGEVILRENPAEDVARGAKPLEVEGLAKPLAARLSALAGARQTLVTRAASDAIAAEAGLPGGSRATEAAPVDPERRDGPGWDVVAHGHYRVKGIAEPVEVLEVGLPGDAPFLPPPDSAKAYRVTAGEDGWRPAREVPHSLPAERDAFIGRGAELAALHADLEAGHRLVTLLGPGGTGKTRLVRRYGWTWLGDWPGGVWFADLSEARDAVGITAAAAAALGLRLGTGDAVTQVGDALAARGRCLLVLDNFEQVVAHAPATLGRWLERAAAAAFVVTSRERLALGGERVMPVEPLPVDADGIELFLVRARAQVPGYEVDAAGRATLIEVVRLLDGLPLAIELAAARVRLLAPEQLLARLESRFRLLVGARGTQARQATLRAAIDWSWALLAPWEQAALAQASCFAGGFMLEAAEAVLDLDRFPDAALPLDAVQSLLDKSLLRRLSDGSSGGGRLTLDEPFFGMYFSIHEYAAEKLRSEGAVAEGASGPAAEQATFARHGAHYATHGSEAAIAALDAPGGAPRRARLALELQNLIVACRRAIARGDGAVAADTFVGAWSVLNFRGPVDTTVALARELLAMNGLTGRPRRRCMIYAGETFEDLGDAAGAESMLLEAAADAAASGDRVWAARAAGSLGSLYRQVGRLRDALPHIERALALFREIGDPALEGLTLGRLANLHLHAGRVPEARRAYAEALAIHRRIGDRRREAEELGNLAALETEHGSSDEALRLFAESLAVLREVGNRRWEGRALLNLAALLHQRGDLEGAWRRYEECQTILREVGDKRLESYLLVNLAALHLDLGRGDDARRTARRALTIAEDVGDPRVRGAALDLLARLEARDGSLEEAYRLLGEAAQTLRHGDPAQVAKLRCTRGECELRAGDRAGAAISLAETEAYLRELGADARSDLGRRIEALRRAIIGSEETRPVARPRGDDVTEPGSD